VGYPSLLWRYNQIKEAEMENTTSLFCIRNTITGDYWNNILGWVEHSDYDIFNLNEKETLNLPIEGEWVEMESEFILKET
jgi:hypothetical protein